MEPLFSTLFSNTWGLALVVVFFGGSIFVHELGHYAVARWRGLKVERFSIGFGPKIFGWEKNGTVYQVSLFPLGGYVALPQLAEMGALEGVSETPAEKLPPISYTSKVLVSAAGAVFNVVFALFIACILWVVGVPSSEMEQSTTVGHVRETLPVVTDKANEGEEGKKGESSEGALQTVPGPALIAGLQAGDIITHVDGSAVRTFKEIQNAIVTGSGRDEAGNPRAILTVRRGSENLQLTLAPVHVRPHAHSIDTMRAIGVAPAHPVVVDSLIEGAPAFEAGLQPGDTITAINGAPVYSLAGVQSAVAKLGQQPLNITLQRAQQTLQLTVQPRAIPLTKPTLKVLPANVPDALTDAQALTLVPMYADEAALSQSEILNANTPSAVTVLTPAEEGPLSIAALAFNSVLEIDGQAPESLSAAAAAINNAGTLAGLPVSANINPPQTHTLLGFSYAPGEVTLYPNPVQQIKDSVALTLNTLGSLINPRSDISLKHLSGPISIGRVIHRYSEMDLRLVLWFVVFLNINLAILNMLPIPVLDGGHIAFATIGKLRGKPLPLGLITRVQGSFMFLLLGLMFYVLLHDGLRWKGDANAEAEFKEAAQQANMLYLKR